MSAVLGLEQWTYDDGYRRGYKWYAFWYWPINPILLLSAFPIFSSRSETHRQRRRMWSILETRWGRWCQLKLGHLLKNNSESLFQQICL